MNIPDLGPNIPEYTIPDVILLKGNSQMLKVNLRSTLRNIINTLMAVGHLNLLGKEAFSVRDKSVSEGQAVTRMKKYENYQKVNPKKKKKEGEEEDSR